jgi:Ras-related protein Rab-18
MSVKVGSKLDKAAMGNRAVSFEEGKAFAEAQGASGFCEISSKTRENVKRPFVEVVDRIVQKPQLIAGAVHNSQNRTTDFDIGGFTASDSCSC